MEVQQADTRVVDFYELMGVPEDADIKTIKRAYYDLAMYCHPDRSGDDGHDLCVVLNDAYAILKDPVQREAYDAELAVQREDDLDEFTGKPYSKWTTRKAEPGETRAVFVDEFTCIGCKQCVWAAPATFRMEDEHGRSRVYAQWLNSEEDIDCAIASCPVDCIHWVQKEQLPYLEHVTRFVDKVSVGIMQSGQGRQSVTDPFDAAYAYQKFRERKIEQRRLKLEEERRNREWAEANAREKEGSVPGGSSAGGAGSANDPDAFSRRRDYGKAVGRIMETWAAGTGVKMETMKRRRWSDSGATIPLERALVPLAEVERMNAEMEKETVPTSR
jgi:ferredoxin